MGAEGQTAVSTVTGPHSLCAYSTLAIGHLFCLSFAARCGIVIIALYGMTGIIMSPIVW